jgi:SnoaL-like domain
MLNYAAGVDERDRERYSACFADNVLIVGFGSGNYEGRESWVEYVWSALDKYSATQHMLGPVYATLEEGIASARTDVQATHFLKDDGGRFTLWATYLTEFCQADSKWLISRHELKVCGTHTDS